MKLEWHNEKRKVVDLIPADYNPRLLTEKDRADLKKSIERFNDVEPVVVNTGTRANTLIGGHQRVTIYADLGKLEIDVRVPNRELTIAEETELNIRLNKNTGRWDEEKLTQFDKGLLFDAGFDKYELSKLFDVHEAKDDSFDAEAAKNRIDQAKTKTGDVYKLGKHRLLCGDATKPEDYEKLMAGELAQMTFTDPPYNVAYQKGTEGEIQNDDMDAHAFHDFLLKACQRINSKTIGGIYICMSSSELGTLREAFEEAGGHWSTFVIWVKNTFTLGRGDYQQTYEPILYGWPSNIKNHFFNPARDIANVWEDLREIRTAYDGEHTTIKFQGFEVKIKGKVEGQVKRRKQITDIWRYDKPTKNPDHPTMKPIGLCAEAIKNSSAIGDIVLDPFAGSGSTLIAAERMDRRCFAMELDQKYCDVIVARWEEATGQKAEKVG